MWDAEESPEMILFPPQPAEKAPGGHFSGLSPPKALRVPQAGGDFGGTGDRFEGIHNRHGNEKGQVVRTPH